MVTSNTGVPDPDNPNEELRIDNEIVFGVADDDSDQELESDDRQMEYGQYQPLPTSPNEESECISEDNMENDTYNSTPTLQSDIPVFSVPPITSMESSILKELWSGPSTDFCDIKMDSQTVQEVKKVMLNIKLPPSAIPDWAANIPEEEWKNQLMKHLKK